MIFLVLPIFSRIFYCSSIFNIDGFIELFPSPVYLRISMIAVGPGSITLSNIPPYPHLSLKNSRIFINGMQ
jgi:hypothetical protein